MANRSYLYATDVLPSIDGPDADNAPYRSIAEWRYDIPLCCMLLLSCKPQACPSAIWPDADDIAIAADYAGGVAALRQFLGRIDFPGAARLVEEALAFLTHPDNQRKYFVLEAGELFDMSDEPMDEQCAELVDTLGDLEDNVDEALAELRAQRPKPLSWIAKLTARKPPVTEDPLFPIYKLGLGNWSNVLYFDFGES